MPYLAIAIGGFAAGSVLVGTQWIARCRSYRRIASQAHCGEIRDWLSQAVSSIAQHPPGGLQATLTSAGIALALSGGMHDGVEHLDVSFSETGRRTRAAVAQRIGALILHLLDRNRAAAALYRTRTGVRHLVLSQAPSSWVVRDASEVTWRLASPVRLPFRRCDAA